MNIRKYKINVVGNAGGQEIASGWYLCVRELVKGNGIVHIAIEAFTDLDEENLAYLTDFTRDELNVAYSADGDVAFLVSNFETQLTTKYTSWEVVA